MAIQTAMQVVGAGRGRWQWDGKLYTSMGVLVPDDVREVDERLIEDNKEIVPDWDVLDMKVTLPVESLPSGFKLADLPDHCRNPEPQAPSAKKKA